MLGCGISVSWLGFPARAVASYRSLASLRFHHKSTARRERAWTYHHSRETSATSSFSARAELGAFAFSLERSCARGPNPPSSAEAADAGTPLATVSPLCPGAVRVAIKIDQCRRGG